MNMIGNLMRTASLGCAVLIGGAAANATTIPVTSWMVHNGTSSVGGTAAAPTCTPADNATLMAPFADVILASDGDFIEGKTTLTLNARTMNTGTNFLNTQLRFALLDSTTAAPTPSDFPNVGLTMEYTNTAAGGLMREQSSATQTNPFTSPTTIGNGTQDANAGSIQGANPGAVTFDYKFTRNGGKLDLSGTISGTDSVTGNPYLAPFTFNGWSSTTFPAGGSFTFHRMAVFLGPNVDATSATLTNSSVTTIPEPASWMLGSLAIGGLLLGRRAKSRAKKPAQV
jgi:hypothetical protein